MIDVPDKYVPIIAFIIFSIGFWIWLKFWTNKINRRNKNGKRN